MIIDRLVYYYTLLGFIRALKNYLALIDLLGRFFKNQIGFILILISKEPTCSARTESSRCSATLQSNIFFAAPPPQNLLMLIEALELYKKYLLIIKIAVNF